jgi:hypothetical protein
MGGKKVDVAKFEKFGYRMEGRNKRLTVGFWFTGARGRARKRGFDWNITLDDVTIPDTCPILGIPLFFSPHDGRACDNTPSFDRVDNSKGYVVGNVRVISLLANKIKTDLSLEMIENLYKYTKGLI